VIAGITADLVVEGDAGDDIGSFRGRVLAIAVAGDGDSRPQDASTWLLVADEQRPAPVWVLQDTVTAQRLGR
jgi:hypothetical protein